MNNIDNINIPKDKKSKKLNKIIVISLVVLIILFLIFYESLFSKILYKPYSDYENTYYSYNVDEKGIYLYINRDGGYYNGIKVYKMKSISTNKLIIVESSNIWGKSSNILKAKNIDIEPLKDWNIKKIKINEEIEITDINLINALQDDLLNESKYNYTDIELTVESKLKHYINITIYFKQTSSISLNLSILEAKDNMFYQMSTGPEFEYKLVGDEFLKYLIENWVK